MEVKKEMKGFEDKGETVPKSLRTKIAQIDFALRAKNEFGKVSESKEGEYFAEYCNDSKEWCVFHTDKKTGHAYASFASKEDAEKKAKELNAKKVIESKTSKSAKMCDCPECDGIGKLFNNETKKVVKVEIDRRSKSYKESIAKIMASEGCDRESAVNIFDEAYEKLE